MPDPADNFQLIKADLKAAGFKVNPKPRRGTRTTSNAVQAGEPDIFLLGWTGDYGDPDNFLGTFFAGPTAAVGASDDPESSSAAERRPTQEPDPAKRRRLYKAGERADHRVPARACRSRTVASPRARGQGAGSSGPLTAEFPVPLTTSGPVRHRADARSPPDGISVKVVLRLRTTAAAARPDPAGALDPALRSGSALCPAGRRGPPRGAGHAARPIGAINELYGLDQPLIVAVLRFLVGRLTARLRQLHPHQQPGHWTEFSERFPATIELTVAAMIFAVGVGIPLGYFAARRHGTWLDHSSVVGSLIGIAIPVFFLAYLLKYVFAVQARLAAPRRPPGLRASTPPASPASTCSTAWSPATGTRSGTRSGT